MRRAALAHDLGRAGVSNCGLGEGRAALPSRSGRRCGSHPHLTERLFARCAGLEGRSRAWPAPITSRSTGPATSVGAWPATSLDTAARIVAAAGPMGGDAEARPYHPAMDVGRRPRSELEAAVDAGRLDRGRGRGAAGDGGRAGRRAGPRPRPAAAELPGGLTDRELDVLRVLVLGGSNQEIGGRAGHLGADGGHAHRPHLRQGRECARPGRAPPSGRSSTTW